MQIHEKTCRRLCINLNFLFLLACDDECVGVLLNDLDYIGDAILSVNLTGVIPVPSGILSNLENTTKYLRVGTENTEMGRKPMSLRDGRVGGDSILSFCLSASSVWESRSWHLGFLQCDQGLHHPHANLFPCGTTVNCLTRGAPG